MGTEVADGIYRLPTFYLQIVPPTGMTFNHTWSWARSRCCSIPVPHQRSA
jgi:hypothetical protein